MSTTTAVTRVSDIALHVRDQTHHLTSEQARILRDQLNEVLDDSPPLAQPLWGVLVAAKAWRDQRQIPGVKEGNDFDAPYRRARLRLDDAVDRAEAAGLL